jgi:hypothetical protein
MNMLEVFISSICKTHAYSVSHGDTIQTSGAIQLKDNSGLQSSPEHANLIRTSIPPSKRTNPDITTLKRLNANIAGMVQKRDFGPWLPSASAQHPLDRFCGAR